MRDVELHELRPHRATVVREGAGGHQRVDVDVALVAIGRGTVDGVRDGRAVSLGEPSSPVFHEGELAGRVELGGDRALDVARQDRVDAALGGVHQVGECLGVGEGDRGVEAVGPGESGGGDLLALDAAAVVVAAAAPLVDQVQAEAIGESARHGVSARAGLGTDGQVCDGHRLKLRGPPWAAGGVGGAVPP